jgi:hypothetical protein
MTSFVDKSIPSYMCRVREEKCTKGREIGETPIFEIYLRFFGEEWKE